MASQEFTEKEQLALVEIARIDDWPLERLERAVRNRMFDGTSFKRAVMLTLATAERPVEEDKKITDMRLRVEKMKQEAVARFKNSLRVGDYLSDSDSLDLSKYNGLGK